MSDQMIREIAISALICAALAGLDYVIARYVGKGLEYIRLRRLVSPQNMPLSLRMGRFQELVLGGCLGLFMTGGYSFATGRSLEPALGGLYGMLVLWIWYKGIQDGEHRAHALMFERRSRLSA